jgi:hypothetical protein
MDDTHVEQQRQFNMRVYEGVVKGWDQFIVDYRDTYGQSNDLPDNQVDQERQTF